ncbi:MAG: PAS domain-containing protein [Sphingomonas sp.]
MSWGHTVADAAGRIIEVDEAMCALLHRSKREITGLSYLAITHPADQARNAIAVASLPGDGAARLIRKRYLRGDGSLVWTNLHVLRQPDAAGGGRLIGKISWADDEADRIAPGALWSTTRRLIDEIGARRRLLGAEIFADHAWLILLETYLAEAEGRLVDADAIADRIDAPVSVVSRWVKALHARGLIEFHEAGRRYCQLSHLGSNDVETLLSSRTLDGSPVAPAA